jgi:hypothetical protein
MPRPSVQDIFSLTARLTGLYGTDGRKQGTPRESGRE